MRKSILILASVCLLCSCGKKSDSSLNSVAVSLSKLPPANTSGIPAVGGADCADVSDQAFDANPTALKEGKNPVQVKAPVIKKKIIKDGKLSLQVSNQQEAKHRVDSLVKAAGGYYANENMSNTDYETGYELVIRIPVQNFDKFLCSAEAGSSKVLFKEIQARDVTEEFVDLETRMNSKRNALARYNEIMKKANSVKDIIEIEQSIRIIQEEIESTEGRLRYLNDCVNYSSLNLTLSTEKDFSYKPAKRDSFWEKLKESVVEGWFGLVDFILWIINLWPFWLILTGIYFLIRKLIRKIRKNKKSKRSEK